MLVYHYDRITKEYKITTQANVDPKIPNRYLLPACASFTPIPETKEGYAIVYNETSKTWEYIEDYRGKTIWQDYQTSKKIMKIGSLPFGWSLTQPEAPIYISKKEKSRQISFQTNQILYKGVVIHINKVARKFIATTKFLQHLCMIEPIMKETETKQLAHYNPKAEVSPTTGSYTLQDDWFQEYAFSRKEVSYIKDKIYSFWQAYKAEKYRCLRAIELAKNKQEIDNVTFNQNCIN